MLCRRSAQQVAVALALQVYRGTLDSPANGAVDITAAYKARFGKWQHSNALSLEFSQLPDVLGPPASTRRLPRPLRPTPPRTMSTEIALCLVRKPRLGAPCPA